MRKQAIAYRLFTRADAAAMAHIALPVVRASPDLKRQLFLFKSRSIVDKGQLIAVYRSGLRVLIEKGLVAGLKGGQKFTITNAGTVVLRELLAESK